MTNRGLLIFLLPFLMACSHNRLDIDVSGVNIDEVKIDRLEEDLFTANPVTIELHQRLEKKYGTIYNSFLTIINGTWISDSASVKGLNLFTRDSAMREAYNDCKKIFPNTNWIVPQLSNVFKHFKHYFPKRNQPRVITYMSGFNYSLLAQDSTFGLGLEMYLGKENKFYTMLQFPKYKTIKMSKEYIVSDFVYGWMMTEFPKHDAATNLLNEIIYYGKLLYLCDALLPNEHDSIKMGYTQQQLNWCKQNEYNIWAYFVQKKIVYTSDPAEVMKYTGEGPFTSAISKDCPARIGTWIGWQIVRSFMDHHPELSLQELMGEQDSQSILSRSKYKPDK